MSRTLASAFLVVAMTIPGVPLAAQASPAATVRAQIQQAVRAYVEANNKPDPSGLAEMYSREVGVTSIADGEITRGWDAIRTEADSIMGLGGHFRISLGSIDVTPISTGHALAVAGYTTSVVTDRGDVQVRGAISLVFKRIAGEWKIVHDHTSTQGLPEPDAGDQAVPSPGNPADAAYIAAMKSDLRNLVTAEEAFFADSIRYTERVGRGGLEFAVSAWNTPLIIKVTGDGWTATIGNVRTRARCAIFVGSTPVAPATREGEPKCS